MRRSFWGLLIGLLTIAIVGGLYFVTKGSVTSLWARGAETTTTGPSALELTVLDAAGDPARGATVELYSEFDQRVVWRGKTDQRGQVTVNLDADISKSTENIVWTLFEVRVNFGNQKANYILGFDRVKYPSKLTKRQLADLVHPAKYAGTLKQN